MTDYSKFKPSDAFKQLDPNAWQTESTAGFSSIRYRSKAWVLNHGGKNYPFCRADDGTPLSYLDIIILAVNKNKSRIYFGPDEWTEDSRNAPICASIDGIAPDPGVPEPQSRTCAVCPHSEWVVKPDGSKKPECQQHFRVAVLPMPAMTKNILPAPLREPVFFKIPPGSFKSWDRFRNDMIYQGIPLASVVTRVAFSPPPKTFEMTFEPIQKLGDADFPAILDLMEAPQTKVISGHAPELREIAAPPARVETGLLSAFDEVSGSNGSEPIQSTRPATIPVDIDEPNPPRQTRQRKSRAPVQLENPPAEPMLNVTDEPPWEESDSEIDASINRLMGDKMNKMLK